MPVDVLRDSERHGIQRVQRGDRALSFRYAERLYGIPAHKLRLFQSARLIDGFRLGRSVFISERSLIAFLERHREPAERVTE